MGSALRPVADFSSSGSSGDSIFSSWAGADCCARAVVTAGSALGCCSGRSGRMSSRSSCAVCGAGAANCGVLGTLNGARTEFSSITPLVPGSVRAGTGAVSLFNARYSAAERVLKCFCGCGGWAGATAGRWGLDCAGALPGSVVCCGAGWGFFCHMAQIKATLSAAGGSQGRAHRAVDRIEHIAFPRKTDLGFGGVYVDVHQVRRHINAQDGAGVLPCIRVPL